MQLRCRVCSMATVNSQNLGNGTLSPQLTGAPSNEEGATNKQGGQGGWITFPFIIVGVMGMSLATSSLFSNLIVYLIGKFNIESINAAQILNLINGCINIFPIVGAILADSFWGNLFVLLVSSFISLLGVILMTLTASISSLRPPHCTIYGSNVCHSPSTLQFAVLYTAIALLCIGLGGMRVTTVTLGADQFDNPKHRTVFFNWCFISSYVAAMIGSTAIVYIQDNVGWGLGFGFGVAASALALAVIILGRNYYRLVKARGIPFTSIARVLVAAIRNRKAVVSYDSKDYYYEGTESDTPVLSLSLRFLNRAALRTGGDINPDGSIAKPWSLCTLQQVEDLKTLLRLFPLWTTGMFLSIQIAIQNSLVVLQALSMDRHIGPHFKIPAGSFLVFLSISTTISLFITDCFFFPMWQKLTRGSLRPLQRIGIGHVFNIAGMATSALVESKRLHIARSHHLADQTGSIVPMSALWLVVPLAIVGIGEAFHAPGQVELYYQEFPASLRSTSTAMISLNMAIAYYLSTAIINMVRRVTMWLPANINDGQIDNVFWLLVVMGVINFGYYIACSVCYKHQTIEKPDQSASE